MCDSNCTCQKPDEDSLKSIIKAAILEALAEHDETLIKRSAYYTEINQKNLSLSAGQGKG